MKLVQILRTGKPDEPLVVTLTGARLGDRVYFHGARAEWLVPLGARVGLSGQVVLIADRATDLKDRAEREGVLVEVADAPEPGAGFDLAIVDATGNWAATLPALLAAVRRGGRIVVLAGGAPAGLLARFRKQAPDASGDPEIVTALSAAGWGRARPIDSHQGLRAVEAFHL